MSFVQVLTAVDTQEHAQLIAQTVVEQRLAACAQVIGPISSIYWWKGQLETAGEFLCLLKTRADLYRAVEQAVREAHPYEVPEILAMPVSAGLPAYLAWVEGETAHASS